MKLELEIVGLLARNAEKKLTINEIAKALKEHYSFVHRIVNRLVKDGVVAKEKAGKSHLCSLNLSSEKAIILINLSEIEKKNEFYDSNKELKVILDDFVKSAEAGVKPISIVLFGSYAKGTATKESDVDVLLIGRAKNGVDKVTKEAYAKYGKEINVIAITPEDFKRQKKGDLVREIVKEHYVLYGADKFVDMVFK